MTQRLPIAYFSDVLCVWAWIAELRNKELLSHFEGQVELDCHFLPLFADTADRIGQGWRNRGGYAGFADHVRSSARQYELTVHEDAWTRVRPTTSANAHLVIKAIASSSGKEAARSFATKVRGAFFEHARDIGELDILFDIANLAGHDEQDLRLCIRNGRAISELLADTKLASDGAIAGSPTWVLNQGRQTLYGNIGYRVLHANVEELLRRPEREASWC